MNEKKTDVKEWKTGIKNTDLIRIYLAECREPLGLFLLFGCIFAVVFYLYRLPVEAVLYGMALCFIPALTGILLNYRGFWKKYRIAERIRSEFQADPDSFYLEDLPHAKTQIEKEYQALIYLYSEDRKRMRGIFEASRGDMADYYTMWVHQIKTPISAMHLLLQTEETGQAGDNGELKEQLFKIEEYVNMILQYLRLDGGSDLVIKTHDLDEIVRQAVRKYAGMFVRKRLTLNFEPLNCQVLTDEKWLVFVIEQVISNAIKYTKQGGISIYMEKGKDHILVISDTGIGIALEDQPRIFEKGFTGYNGRSDKKSTGIGLYLCRRILTRLSHTVAVESEPGVGTKIKIDLSTERLKTE